MNIQISGLEFSYPNGAPVLRGISLEVGAGSRIALLGQNGAGKTTLVKHLNGLLKPSQGQVCVGDWDTCEHSIAQLARRVGFVFQNPDDQLFKTSVEDEIAFGPTNLLRANSPTPDKTEIARRVTRALQLCALESVRTVHPYDLPPWQRRWVAIASVVAMETPIVVLDEPTTGQDAPGLARLALLLDEWQRKGVTVIAVTHDIDFAAEQFQEIIVMAQGQVLARGDPAIFADESILTRAALDAPQVMRLGRALGWQSAPANVETFVERWSQSRKHAD